VFSGQIDENYLLCIFPKNFAGDFNFRFDIFLNGTLCALPAKVSHATEADSISESNLKS